MEYLLENESDGGLCYFYQEAQIVTTSVEANVGDSPTMEPRIAANSLITYRRVWKSNVALVSGKPPWRMASRIGCSKSGRTFLTWRGSGKASSCITRKNKILKDN